LKEEKYMNKYKILQLLFILLFSVSVVYGNDPASKSLTKQNNEDDSTYVGRYSKFHFKWKFWRDEFMGKPSISLNYGFSQMNIDGFNESFSKPGIGEIKLGHTDYKEAWDNEDIIDYSFHYLRLSNFSTDLDGNSSDINGIKSKMWRFGIGWQDGYGYKFGTMNLIPYYSRSFDWSRLDITSQYIAQQGNGNIDLFNNAFRFGTSWEGGVKFQVVNGISLEAGYEKSIIFRRHLFWKWAGSYIIETGGEVLLNNFIDDIMSSSPYAAPVVNFVLKNALSYGIYELRKEKMNWPFASEPPLTYNQFKFGVNFVF
jgi:hypothetical protein